MSSSVFSSSNPQTSDNTKNIGSNFVAIAAGVGVSQTITPVVPQQNALVMNMSNNWVRVGVVPTANVTFGGALANRVWLIPPNKDVGINFDSGVGSNDPIASLSVIAVNKPTTTTESGAAVAATAATAGDLLINWLS